MINVLTIKAGERLQLREGLSPRFSRIWRTACGSRFAIWRCPRVPATSVVEELWSCTRTFSRSRCAGRHLINLHVARRGDFNMLRFDHMPSDFQPLPVHRRGAGHGRARAVAARICAGAAGDCRARAHSRGDLAHRADALCRLPANSGCAMPKGTSPGGSTPGRRFASPSVSKPSHPRTASPVRRSSRSAATRRDSGSRCPVASSPTTFGLQALAPPAEGGTCWRHHRCCPVLASAIFSGQGCWQKQFLDAAVWIGGVLDELSGLDRAGDRAGGF